MNSIKNTILEKGQKVVVTESHRVWRKIYAPSTTSSGWLHHKTIRKSTNRKDVIKIDKSNFRKVFTNKNKPRVYSYIEKKPLKMSIPKGSGFYTLMKKKDKILVLVGETSTLIWLAQGDAS